MLTASSTPEANRALRVSGRICAIGKYQAIGFTPWTGTTGSTHRQYLTSATFASDMSTFSYLNLIYLLYSCSSLVGDNGTQWSSGNTGYAYMRIDRVGQAGYLTEAT